MSGHASGVGDTAGQIALELAAKVDRKIDDGNPYGRSFQFSAYAPSGSVAPNAATCVTGTIWNINGEDSNCAGAKLVLTLVHRIGVFRKNRANRSAAPNSKVPITRWSPRQESNLYLALRRHSFYPLNYGESGDEAHRICTRGSHLTASSPNATSVRARRAGDIVEDYGHPLKVEAAG
jgi:hypothetical protein